MVVPSNGHQTQEWWLDWRTLPNLKRGKEDGSKGIRPQGEKKIIASDILASSQLRQGSTRQMKVTRLNDPFGAKGSEGVFFFRAH
jgi:hypothetical protein